MLFEPSRHEALEPIPWDDARARATILRIVRDCERRFSPSKWWPLHPKDADGGETEPALPLYHGACGVIWALHYLAAVGAAPAQRDFTPHLEALREGIVGWLAAAGATTTSYLIGETAVLMYRYGRAPTASDAERLAAIIAGNVDHPSRELMWGAPGTMLAALFLHRRTGEERWADLFRTSARTLWSQLEWSPEYACRYWPQDLYGRRTSYIDGVHGIVATATPLIHGRDLLAPDEWTSWSSCIAETVSRTATREGVRVNWRNQVYQPPDRPMLMQYCHGAPGFIVCLADFPDASLDALLIGGGEAVWEAGPLRKGANLCHGTGGNGYAFLKLFERTRDPMWLTRARAFAMHAIAQCEQDEARYGGLRYSLWTGDPGLAIYLWDCVRGAAAFPTIDVFYGG